MRARNALTAIGVLGLVAACVDITPREFTAAEPDGGANGAVFADAAAADSGRPGPGTPVECRECITAEDGACRSAYDGCAATEGCPQLVECLFDDGCFTLPDLQERIDCGQPCFDAQGIFSALQPALEAAIPLNGCTQQACQAECIRESP